MQCSFESILNKTLKCDDMAPVAQLDRVLVSEAKGRGFDSRRARQKLISYSLNNQ
jgi:hypothetical protein